MTAYVRHGAIEIAPVLHRFVENEVLPGTGIACLENTYVVDPDGLRSLNTAPEDLMVL